MRYRAVKANEAAKGLWSRKRKKPWLKLMLHTKPKIFKHHALSRAKHNHLFNQQRNSKRRQVTPLPMPLSKVLPIIQQKGLLTKKPKCTITKCFASCNCLNMCDYHMGERGHSKDYCLPLKCKVQDLIDVKMFSFRNKQNPTSIRSHCPIMGKVSILSLSKLDTQLVIPL